MLGVIFFLTVISLTQSANILGIFSIPSRSHYVIGSRIMRELANRGHHVTAVSPYEYPGTVGNYTGIYIGNTAPVMENFQKTPYELASMSFVSSTNHLHRKAYELTAALLSEPAFQNILKSNDSFDLVLVDYFMNEAALGVAKLFSAPLVLVSTLPSSTLSNHLFANPLPSSYVPNLLTPHSGEMSYWQRFGNLLCNAYNSNYRALRMLPLHEQLLQEHLGGSLDLRDVTTSVNLVLLNSHPSVTEPVPLAPNMIEVGGVHIGPLGDLPQDLEEFLDSSEHGVVVVSVDSHLEREEVESLVGALGRMELDVVWVSDVELAGLPDNVRVVRWVPQAELLAHPNIKAFVTHGGLFSMIEAVYFGVPFVGIPVYGDQKSNVARAVHNGYAVSVPFNEMSGENVVAAIQEVLQPKYSKKVAQRSEALRDRLVDPLDSAVYWIEFVLKRNGAEYFQSPGVKLPSYKKHLIDIIILLVIIDVVLFLVFYYIIKHIIHLLYEKMKERSSETYTKL